MGVRSSRPCLAVLRCRAVRRYCTELAPMLRGEAETRGVGDAAMPMGMSPG